MNWIEILLSICYELFVVYLLWLQENQDPLCTCNSNREQPYIPSNVLGVASYKLFSFEVSYSNMDF